MIDNMQGLFETATECYKSGKRAGASETYRAIALQLSILSTKQETVPNPTGFHVAENACKVAREAFQMVEKFIEADLLKTEGSA